MTRKLCSALTLVAGLFLALGLGVAGYAQDEKKADPALDRAREQVKMLDDLYKNAVISVNKNYDGAPAIKMAKDVFKAMEKNGWHSARLVDATGEPLNEANRPMTAFEKAAEKAIRSGQTYYEEVEGKGSDRKLLAATVVPAVHVKCAKCHGTEVGKLLGFIRYELPVK